MESGLAKQTGQRTRATPFRREQIEPYRRPVPASELYWIVKRFMSLYN